ncbi:MAG: M23 family metallopeptidase [Myxococcales bacterium]|nr:M23 family metallopeptidase [Myxococcales bacterium]
MGRFGVTLLAILLLGAGGVLFWRCEGEPPALDAPESLVVGREVRELVVAASDPGSGLREFGAELRQGEGEPVPLASEVYPGEILQGGIGPRVSLELPLSLDLRRSGLKEGEATLVLRARDWSWRGWLSGNEAVREVPVTVDLSPPRVLVETGLSYVQRGGAGAVVYSIDEGTVRDGVDVAGHFYPGFPFPDEALGETAARTHGRRVALYAIERNAPADPSLQVVAEDAAGNETRASWPARYRKRTFEDTRLPLSKNFLSGKVVSLADQLDIRENDPVVAFQQINEKVRAENEQRIREIVSKGGGERHWRGAFAQLENSAVTSRFAEHRSYFVGDEKVSEAIHYGYDLASTAGAPITAANAGRVLFADDLGIYGRCVIVDHGLGLSSLYAHLSQIGVEPGDPVEKGAVLGRSGLTGLAGGDHLHFAILVGDSYVDPKEWWDPKWVREKVESQFE